MTTNEANTLRTESASAIYAMPHAQYMELAELARAFAPFAPAETKAAASDMVEQVEAHRLNEILDGLEAQLDSLPHEQQAHYKQLLQVLRSKVTLGQPVDITQLFAEITTAAKGRDAEVEQELMNKLTPEEQMKVLYARIEKRNEDMDENIHKWEEEGKITHAEAKAYFDADKDYHDSPKGSPAAMQALQKIATVEQDIAKAHKDNPEVATPLTNDSEENNKDAVRLAKANEQKATENANDVQLDAILKKMDNNEPVTAKEAAFVKAMTSDTPATAQPTQDRAPTAIAAADSKKAGYEVARADEQPQGPSGSVAVSAGKGKGQGQVNTVA